MPETKMRKLVVIKPFNSNIFLRNGLFKINNGTNIFYDLDRKLRGKVDLQTVDMPAKTKVKSFIYLDVPYPWEVGQWLSCIAGVGKNILFFFESPVINPFNHMRFLHIFFNRIYTWDDTLVDSKKWFKFYIPNLDSKQGVFQTTFEKKRFLVTVLANKSAPIFFRILSPYGGDLYSERLKAISFFDKYIPEKFSLYGKGWNKIRRFSLGDRIFGPRIFPSYRGEVKNKIRVLARYKFCLAFENAEAPGYVTEKIFDCFKAGCVPVYLGAPNITKFIPQDCFVDVRGFSGNKELLEYLEKMDKEAYEQYIQRGKAFINNRHTQRRWFEKGFERVFLQSIS